MSGPAIVEAGGGPGPAIAEGGGRPCQVLP
jgi:hypothetical protein